MAQSKKSSASAPKIVAKTTESAANMTTKAMEKAAKTAFSTLETTHKSVQSVAGIGADTLREIFANHAEEAQKAHAKAFAVCREGAEATSRALDAATRTLNDLVALARENVDVAAEVGNIVSDISSTANAELVKYANSNFSDNMDIFNEAFTCRNINDVLELNSKWLSVNLDNLFAQSARLADIVFQFANEASEPVNDHILESAERLSKSLAA